MIDRIAVAIAGMSIKQMGEDGAEMARERARCALREMREPTVEMVGRTHDELLVFGTDQIYEIWQAMIDEALKP